MINQNSLGKPNLDIDLLHDVVASLDVNDFSCVIPSNSKRRCLGNTSALLALMMGELELGEGLTYGVFCTNLQEASRLQKMFTDAICNIIGMPFLTNLAECRVQANGQTWRFMTMDREVRGLRFDKVFFDVGAAPKINDFEKQRRIKEIILHTKPR
jgi:hypothetical protein